MILVLGGEEHKPSTVKLNSPLCQALAAHIEVEEHRAGMRPTREDMVVSLNRRTPINTPIYY